MSTSLDSFPKLKDVTPEGPLFNLECPDCTSKKIDLRPIGINWRVQKTNADLGKAVSIFYDTLPTLQEAIMQAISQQNGLLVICNDCKRTNSVLAHAERTKISKWLDKNEEKNARHDNSNTRTDNPVEANNQTPNVI